MPKLGEKIEQTPEQKDIIKPFIEGKRDAEFGFVRAIELARETTERFWKQLREMHPELDNYEVSYNFKTNTLTITGLRRLPEE